MNENFPRVFKELRTANKLTQDDMANFLNISRSSVGMYEQGKREPSYEMMEKIADYFNVDIDYLIGRKETTERIPTMSNAFNERLEYYLNNSDEINKKVLNSIMTIVSAYPKLPKPYQKALYEQISEISKQAKALRQCIDPTQKD